MPPPGPRSLNDLIASQDALLREAALALPHEFSRCTFTMGPIRQAVYLCLTCATPRGICSSCSIACHTDHEQVELFPKRHFRCDCPTAAIPHPCTLHKNAEEENSANRYGQNFQGLFCRCARPYDPKTEPETMIQCLACEDWFHESCLNLRERPPVREQEPDVPELEDTTTDDDDDCSDASSFGLPPPLITADDYDSFVCAACVSKVPILHRYAGTKGVIMVVRDGDQDPWRRLEGDTRGSSEDPLTLDVADPPPGTLKRSSSSSHDDGPEPKRSRPLAPVSCLAPAVNPVAQAIFKNQASGSERSTPNGCGDVFLTKGFRERWCRCEHCLPSLQAHPYLLEQEETYEPPEDPDSGMMTFPGHDSSLTPALLSGLSFEELGARALGRLPRDRAIDGIHAFNEMRDHLLAYLRPFAQQGKIVEAADVTQFFETLREKRARVD